MTRILLTGTAGQLGQELKQSLAALGEVRDFDRQMLDLAQPDKIRQAVAEVKPDLIVNAAAYTAVDKAENENELANAINGTAPTIMAEEAQRLGAVLIHVSTDYIFDGRKNTPYTEDDTPNPLSAYGQSKLLGEEGVQQKCDRYIILRTAWVYGVGGKGNFVKTMLRLGAEREELRVVVDQVGSPTWTRDIARTIAQLGQKISPELGSNGMSAGIYHFTNSGAISWYDFAVAIFEEAQQIGFPLKVRQVVPIITSEYPTPAPRPAYSVLSSQKISAILGNHPPHWRTALRQMLKQLYTQN
ncbi:MULTISPECIES: dTDP-4-dehydrorhamnose reductase [unclassified Coleofasciculus]|uniref:dTDP-4-dehydrorhamnose reductase n=1 Tax=unclassified Coleofasciculus TaxID=2692782 RepID=UPI00187EC48F|nr:MULTISPECIES: dTDP-4-dehydrorhamnose reductase [unclassified Coleofasciculus]MBE9125775.1 dTDP-4-dehydrorhamnose reductase [Coleofasciculus sp. LEGE 07081]MBE9148448.1 dTDP-4-dehydrorhamnose reductase [Coleofasciculus sp. LEGE 07092]